MQHRPRSPDGTNDDSVLGLFEALRVAGQVGLGLLHPLGDLASRRLPGGREGKAFAEAGASGPRLKRLGEKSMEDGQDYRT